jgi:hypothetical protein
VDFQKSIVSVGVGFYPGPRSWRVFASTTSAPASGVPVWNSGSFGWRLWYLASAAAAGCATLVKGPVGFLIPAFVVTGLQSLRPAARRCFSPLNVLVFLVVVLPWFLSLGAREPGVFYYGLVEESFHRFPLGACCCGSRGPRLETAGSLVDRPAVRRLGGVALHFP